jgi:hypothetical protein
MKRLLLVICALLANVTSAHPLQASAVAFDLHDDVVGVSVLLPTAQLAQVISDPLQHRDELLQRAQAQIAMRALDGAPFALTWSSVVDTEMVDGVEQLVLHATAQAPRAADLRVFVLTDTLLVDAVKDHRIYVEVRRDFAAGVLHEPQLVGVLSATERSVVVDRGAGSWLTGTRAVFQLGRHHIADGTDHLLFLLVLLVPAAVRAREGRWREPSTTTQALLQMLGVVSTFTVGHSITLALAALDVVRVPSTAVEVVIALSILVSAVHAWRPLFAGREHVVAGAFGVVHGLAFATTLAELGVQGRALWLSLLAFNVGIEVQQLLIVAATMPWLLLLSRTRFAAGVRAGLALVAAVAAIAWTVERIFNVETPVTVAVEAVAAHGWWVLLALASTSLLTWWRERR